MPCSICGDICRCGSSPEAVEEESAVSREDQARNDLASNDLLGIDLREPAPDAWRAEVAARLNRYQSRRKPRPPRYPSLLLPFENTRPNRAPAETCQPPALHLSHHALALDGFAERDDLDDFDLHSQVPASASEASVTGSAGSPDAASAISDASTPPLTAKIIEFPRSWTPPMPPADQLAEPVSVHPRILEAPDVAPPPPALGGITIEPAPQPEIERLPGIDFPLQSASLARRISAAAIDAAIILTACSLFAFIFWKITALRPPAMQAAEIIAGLAALLWATYQYLLVVYAGATPGLRLARLALSRFDGTPATRRSRRWRVLASVLSALSLGMGYAWVFLDEDALCWHDRITHTYLSPSAVISRMRS